MHTATQHTQLFNYLIFSLKSKANMHANVHINSYLILFEIDE